MKLLDRVKGADLTAVGRLEGGVRGTSTGRRKTNSTKWGKGQHVPL